MPDDRVLAVGRRVGAAPSQRRPVRAPGVDRDSLPPAVGAGARLLRAPRPAGGAQRGAGPRHRCVELSVPLPRRAGARPGAGDRRRSRLRADEGRGGRLAARADADRVRGRAAGSRDDRATGLRAGREAAGAGQRRFGDGRHGRGGRFSPPATGMARAPGDGPDGGLRDPDGDRQRHRAVCRSSSVRSSPTGAKATCCSRCPPAATPRT